ncbi:MAG: hypothetical protein HQ509_03005 [Candidatus Marinimicrobia bacterium]|nr:hypothetical protein [Candidatus Neomarinimicrobiota bacterium]
MKLKVLSPLLLCVNFIFPQSSELSTGLGVAAGMITGSGLSYRNIGESKGIQFTFGIMSFPHDDYDDETYWREDHMGSYGVIDWVPDTSRTDKMYEYSNGGTWGNAGLVFIKPLHRAEKSMFYLLGGVSMYYSSSSDYYMEYKYIHDTDSTYTYKAVSDRKKETTTDYTFRVGAGIGLEYELTENIRFSLDLPLTISDNKQITMIVPEAGLYYYFK